VLSLARAPRSRRPRPRAKTATRKAPPRNRATSHQPLVYRQPLRHRHERLLVVALHLNLRHRHPPVSLAIVHEPRLRGFDLDDDFDVDEIRFHRAAHHNLMAFPRSPPRPRGCSTAATEPSTGAMRGSMGTNPYLPLPASSWHPGEASSSGSR